MTKKQDACRLFHISDSQWSRFRDRLQCIIDENGLMEDKWQTGTAARDRASEILVQQRARIFPPPLPEALRSGPWSQRHTEALMCLATQAKSNLTQRQRRGTRVERAALPPLTFTSEPPSDSQPASATAVANPEPTPLRLEDCQFVINRGGHYGGYTGANDKTFLAKDLMVEGSTTITAERFLRFLWTQKTLLHDGHITIKANGQWSVIDLDSERMWQSCLRINLLQQQQKIICKIWPRRMLACLPCVSPDC